VGGLAVDVMPTLERLPDFEAKLRHIARLATS
jgi:hypothetical protein